MTLTSCGTVGQFGPSLASCQSSYASAYPWTSSPSLYSFGAPAGASLSLWQRLAVPTRGLYSVTAAGASGSYTNGGTVCRGAVVTVQVSLSSTDVIYAMIGQPGSAAVGQGGGGGGTFLLFANGTALVVSGGGGGGYLTCAGYSLCDASVSSSNGNGGNGVSNGGTGGNGGTTSYNCGGGGLLGNGYGSGTPVITNGVPTSYTSNGGISALNGGEGGNYNGNKGGFGGGAYYGGGGGYSGGGGAPSSVCGGGGGSYCIAGLASCSTSRNTGSGYATVTLVSAQ